MTIYLTSQIVTFNSRPPRGGRPQFHSMFAAKESFNSRPPRGGRPENNGSVNESGTFQFTTSKRRSTSLYFTIYPATTALSIHDLQEEVDA